MSGIDGEQTSDEQQLLAETTAATTIHTTTWEPPYPGIALRKRNHHAAYCCQCRIPEELPDVKLFRCSRCKLTRYCSKKCQRQHFGVHKSGCKLLHQANSEPEGNDETVTRTNDLLIKADLVFQITYRSCDTVERGAFMMETALDHYYNHLLLLANTATTTHPELLIDDGTTTFLPFYGSVYDRVRFFLAALGHYEECAIAMGFSSKWDDFSTSNDMSQTLQMTAGLIQMKLIASLRNDGEQLNDGASTEEGLVFMSRSERLAQQEAQLQRLLVTRYTSPDNATTEVSTPTDNAEQTKFWPLLLDRSLFLSESTLPLLFAPDTGHPRELYCFVQDCFFLDRHIDGILTDLIEWYDQED